MEPGSERSFETGKGAIVLVLGILSFVGLGCLTGIPAWVLGNMYLADINRGVLDPAERSMVQAGRILGIIATFLFVCGGALWIGFMVLFMGMFASSMANINDSTFSDSLSSVVQREAILDAAVAERTKSPAKDYSVLAKELSTAPDKKVSWYDDSLTPPGGCGSYTFSGKNGALTVKDGCGSNSVQGWPVAK